MHSLPGTTTLSPALSIHQFPSAAIPAAMSHSPEHDDTDTDTGTDGAPSSSEVDEEEDHAMEGDDEDAGALASDMRERRRREQEKGSAVASQRHLYENFLGVRILLQTCVAGANRLPKHEAVRWMSREDQPASQLLGELASEAKSTLASMDGLLCALAERHPGTRSLKHPAALDEQAAHDLAAPDLWQRLERRQESLRRFRDESVDRWYKRSHQSMAPGTLRAIHQSVAQQVRHHMAEGEEAVLRTRLPARDTVALCGPGRPDADGAESGADVADHAPGTEGDPETFDDAEFYRTLLKEFLESGLAKTGSAKAVMEAQKRRKARDRRASKGRKLRYKVLEKLVNFMAPVPLADASPHPQLFSGLFQGSLGR